MTKENPLANLRGILKTKKTIGDFPFTVTEPSSEEDWSGLPSGEFTVLPGLIHQNIQGHEYDVVEIVAQDGKHYRVHADASVFQTELK